MADIHIRHSVEDVTVDVTIPAKHVDGLPPEIRKQVSDSLHEVIHGLTLYIRGIYLMDYAAPILCALLASHLEEASEQAKEIALQLAQSAEDSRG